MSDAAQERAWETHNICRCGRCYPCEAGLAFCLWCRGGEVELIEPCIDRIWAGHPDREGAAE
jgi:hypothetical protein